MTPLDIPTWINIWSYGEEMQATCHGTLSGAADEIALHISEASPGTYMASWTNDPVWVGSGEGETDLTQMARNTLADWDAEFKDMQREMIG